MPKDPSLRPAIRRHQGSSQSAEALEAALRGEGAISLGKAGKRVEAELAALRAMPNEAEERDAQLYRCAEAVWRFFVQREMCNLLDHVPVVEAYDIPREVLAKVGATPPPTVAN